jgi:hypothetical protein
LGVIEASDLNDEKVSRIRRLHCKHYDGCVDHAMRRNWESFSCEACPVHELIDRPRWEREREGLIALAAAILSEDPPEIHLEDLRGRTPRKPLTTAHVRRIVRLHDEGLNPSQIADQVGVHRMSVVYWLKKLERLN